MDANRITFEGHDGSLLAARLDLPPRTPRAFVLFAHCFTCGKDIFAASRISAALVDCGLAVLRFDFTGLGASEGEFANTNFSSNIADLVRAADHLRAHYQAPALLVGHSLGGVAVLAAAGEIPEAKAVVTIGAPSEPEYFERQFENDIDAIRSDGTVEVKLAGRAFTITRQFLGDLEATRIHDRVAHLGRALLVMHAPLDEIVDVNQARQLFDAAKHPKSFVSLDSADHLLRRKEDANYAAQVLAAWAERYLPPPATTPLETGIVEVRESGAGKFANVVRAGRHHLPADEPLDAGGGDSGPSPYDYVLAGLGACTSMTLRMYAEMKKLPLTGVSVRLQQQRIHAADCADCNGGQPQITEITREIRLAGDLSDEQRTKLLEIAERCPVHRTLTSEIKIRSLLGVPPQAD